MDPTFWPQLGLKDTRFKVIPLGQNLRLNYIDDRWHNRSVLEPMDNKDMILATVLCLKQGIYSYNFNEKKLTTYVSFRYK